MVKKMLKYAKFMMCCALIFSLVLPSYAALSAADGSAFVTKAEFDAALADFNSRLTTFEAGINSKIDSQVTSYLDRNGIWNGKEQGCAIEPVTGNGIFTRCLDLPLTGSYKIWLKGRRGVYDFIEKINKSGMLIFSYKFDGFGGDCNIASSAYYYLEDGNLSSKSYTGDGRSVSYGCTPIQSLELFDVGNSRMINTITQSGTWGYKWTGEYSGYSNWTFTPVAGTCVTFVKKGMLVKLYHYLLWSGYRFADNSIVTFVENNSSESVTGLRHGRCFLTEPTVY